MCVGKDRVRSAYKTVDVGAFPTVIAPAGHAEIGGLQVLGAAHSGIGVGTVLKNKPMRMFLRKKTGNSGSAIAKPLFGDKKKRVR